MPTCALVTLGCKVNQYDSQAIREELARLGYREVGAAMAADLYVVNTCCVTHESHRKSLQHVRRLARAHPEAVLVVTGCSAETSAEEIRAIPGVRLVAGNDAKPLLARMAAAIGGSGRLSQEPVLSPMPGEAGGPPPAWPSIHGFAGHTRAFVKIEDGCNDFCSYCIVPRVRGRVRSRPPGEVVEEVRRLAANGHLEVVLTGIHLGAYGSETGGAWGLVPLLERLVATPGLRRLRLSSIELREVGDELIELAAHAAVLCPHFHIPLQSGDDAVLRAMNRHYTAADFLARLDAIRAKIAEPALSTDIIVGFPGETDEQFRRTVEVARRAAFSRVHVFPYSDREGTAASRMAGKVAKAGIDARRAQMLAAARELARAYHERFVGRAVEALVETQRDRRTGQLCGYTERYVRAFFDGPDELRGKLAQVVAAKATPRGLEASGADRR